MTAPYKTYEKLWAVTFQGSGVSGDVEAITIKAADDQLTGSGASLEIYTDGAETSSDVRGSTVASSRRGVELGGSFRLGLRQHTTEPIEFNAAASTMKARLEALPNVGTVDVVRSAPGPRREYSWTVSFISNPGYFPVHSRDVALLVPDTSALEPLITNRLNNKSTAAVTVNERMKGSDPLAGSFKLTFCNSTRGGLWPKPGAADYWSPTDCSFSGLIPHDASASSFETIIEDMDQVGDVDVSRVTNADGYTWFITFGGCSRDKYGNDVCNEGDLSTLDWAGPNSSLTGGFSPPNVTVTEVVKGTGPGACTDGPDGLCVATSTDLSGGAPYAYDLLGLTTGERYYTRARWHNGLGFGAYSLSEPEYETPTFGSPGAPPAVRLINSSSTSLAVAWDRPTEDGGAAVAGYELWLDDWQGGNPRMVFDGSDRPLERSFVIRTRTSIGLESGKQYRLTVRAVNYCSARDADLLCRGEFSQPSVFTVRTPRAPLAPLAPEQVALGGPGEWQTGDASIAVQWRAPVDNGGANITAYQLWMARPGRNFEKVFMETDGGYKSVDQVEGRFAVMRHVVDALDEGELYRFYVQAVNARGRSGKSPVSSFVAGTVPGLEDGLREGTKNATYSSVRPANVDVGETSVHVRWRAPAHNSTGGSPITGYRLFMYPGAPLNTVADPDPVKQEVQRVVVTANAPQDETQRVVFDNVASSSAVRLYVDGVWTRNLLRSDGNGAWERAIAIAAGCEYTSAGRQNCARPARSFF